jgi:2-polyprenyl-3-methyl-5-hydroxy-6-metoxy-1,4-benzoquinol methylase
MTIITGKAIRTLHRDSEMTNSTGICYLCREKNLETFPGFTWLVQCHSCGIVFNPDFSINPREVSAHFYDELNVAHRKTIKSVLQNVARARWRWLQRRINLRKGQLLEIGCGTGEFIVKAQAGGWKATGLELSEKFRAAAKEWYNLELQGEELFKAGYPSATFDMVVLLHVFEHLPKPLEFLAQVSAILKPGGWLFIIVPNLASWTDSLFGHSSPVLSKRDHFFHYNPKTLEDVVTLAEFIPVEIATLEPAHHLWTSLYGLLSEARKTRFNRLRSTEKGSGNLSGKIKSKLPYWVGSLTSGLLFPWRLWLQKRNQGHEIYLLCRRPL